MRLNSLPDTVALWLCPAEKHSGEPVYVSGLFDLIEHMPYEPSNYVHAPGFIVARIEDTDGVEALAQDDCLWIDEDAFIEQVDPAAHGRALAQERELDWYQAEQSA